MKKIFVLLSLIVVSIELFAQGGMVDINNDEYNQAVERLILANFERPSYRVRNPDHGRPVNPLKIS